MIYRLTTYGHPQPKGSMKCVGRRGQRGHILVEDDKTGERQRWRTRLTDSAALVARKIGAPIDGPVVIGVVAFVARPKSNRGAHPVTRSTGDVDKHSRMTLDALTDAGVYVDDSRVILLLAGKAWAEGPGHERAIVFVGPPEKRVPQQILAAMLDVAPTLRFEGI